MSFVPPPLPANPPYTPPANLSEFLYRSQFNMDPIGVVINIAGAPVDVDNQAMVVTAYQVPQPGTQLPVNQPPAAWTHPVPRIAPGVYEYTLMASDSATVGYFRLDWGFTLNGTNETISSYYEFGPASPAYDVLNSGFRQIVEDVWAKFADGYDSPQGGPNLQMWYNTHFGRGRIAQLLKQAVQHLNVSGQPTNNYTVDSTSGGAMFPLPGWEGLVNSALTVEVLLHLMRSYAEDPDIQGAVQARMIRRDYMQRWASMLDVEQKIFKEQRDVWRLKQAFRMTPRVLVSGGAYGTYSPVRMIGNLAARPAMWWRFY